MLSRASDVRNEHLDRQRGKCLMSFRGCLEPSFGVSRTVYALFGPFQASRRDFRTSVASCMHIGSYIPPNGIRFSRVFRPDRDATWKKSTENLDRSFFRRIDGADTPSSSPTPGQERR